MAIASDEVEEKVHDFTAGRRVGNVHFDYLPSECFWFSFSYFSASFCQVCNKTQVRESILKQMRISCTYYEFESFDTNAEAIYP